MIEFYLCINLVLIAAAFVFAIAVKTGWDRLLFISLASALITVEIVLYAVLTGQTMYLDIALAFVLLGFMDIQFFSVFLRRKGDLQ